MPQGFVRSFGKKAITIQTQDRKQYYALIENISDKNLLNHLQHPLPYIPVQFDIDTNSHSGTTKFGPRFYATNIHIHLII
tara:strand:+ start:257 stop:496 length:240 start_codon:yes stop_codon:yes gene_type:complete